MWLYWAILLTRLKRYQKNFWCTITVYTCLNVVVTPSGTLVKSPQWRRYWRPAAVLVANGMTTRWYCPSIDRSSSSSLALTGISCLLFLFVLFLLFFRERGLLFEKTVAFVKVTALLKKKKKKARERESVEISLKDVKFQKIFVDIPKNIVLDAKKLGV